MENNELETTLEKLEQEVLDELNNPYHPYSVIFPYEVRLTIHGSEDTDLTTLSANAHQSVCVGKLVTLRVNRRVIVIPREEGHVSTGLLILGPETTQPRDVVITLVNVVGVKRSRDRLRRLTFPATYVPDLGEELRPVRDVVLL